MNVLTNALLLNDKFSGMQYSTELLLQAMGDLNTCSTKNDRIEVLISRDYAGNLMNKGNVNLKQLPFSTVSRLKRIQYENVGLPAYFKKGKFDVYHATSNLLPLFSNIPSILTVHDLVPVAYPKLVRPETYLYYKIYLARSIYKAGSIIAVSNKVKEDIISRYKVDSGKINVVYHGVEKIFKKVVCTQVLTHVVKKYDLPERFLLFVGNLEPKKNLARLIEAVIFLKRKFNIEHKLVIAGQKGWKYEDVFNVKRFGNLDDLVMFTGYVEREDLPAMYSLCDLFVFPSLYEGFGLPALEAMACGAPVLVSNEGSLPEITGDIYPRVNAYDVQDIAAKIHLLLEDEAVRKQNIMHGSARAGFFTWEKTANATLEVYNRFFRTINRFAQRAGSKSIA